MRFRLERDRLRPACHQPPSSPGLAHRELAAIVFARRKSLRQQLSSPYNLVSHSGDQLNLVTGALAMHYL